MHPSFFEGLWPGIMSFTREDDRYIHRPGMLADLARHRGMADDSHISMVTEITFTPSMVRT